MNENISHLSPPLCLEMYELTLSRGSYGFSVGLGPERRPADPLQSHWNPVEEKYFLALPSILIQMVYHCISKHLTGHKLECDHLGI